MMTKRTRHGPGQAHSIESESGRGIVDVERVAARAAEIVLARLSAGLAAEPSAYSTHRDGPRPREYAQRPRAWRQLAPRIPGAVRLGRWVTVPRAAYERWLATQGTRPGLLPTSDAPATTPKKAWSPADLVRDLGLRLDSESKP